MTDLEAREAGDFGSEFPEAVEVEDQLRDRERRQVSAANPHDYPRKALRGGMSKTFFKKCCQLLAINAHKMAPRTSQGLQERAWNTPTKGLEWRGSSFILHPESTFSSS